MLAVVSAVVAFDAWPGGQMSTHTPTLVLADTPAAIRVSANATGPSATPAARRAAAAPAGSRGRVSPGVVPLGAVRGERVTGGQQGPASNAPKPSLPAPVAQPLQQVQQATSPIFTAVSNPATTASQVADTAQGVTDSAGLSLAKVNPEAGTLVQQSGDALAQTVRDLPLPQSLLPGQ